MVPSVYRQMCHTSAHIFSCSLQRAPSSFHHLFSKRAFAIVPAQECVRSVLEKEKANKKAQQEKEIRASQVQIADVKRRIIASLQNMTNTGNQYIELKWDTLIYRCMPEMDHLMNSLKEAGYEVSFVKGEEDGRDASRRCVINFKKYIDKYSYKERGKITIEFKNIQWED